MRIFLRRHLSASVLVPPLSGLAALAAGCISSNPTGEPSGVDASVPAQEAGAPPLVDATVPADSAPPGDDSPAPPSDTGSVTPEASAADASDAGPDVFDAAPAIGAIFGKVLDVNQFGRGVVAGATVSVVGGPSTTTDLDGQFNLAGVTAGPRVLVTVSTPTTAGVAYGTAQVVVSVAGGQSTEVYPEVLEGCVATADLAADAGVTVTLQNGCSARTGAYVSVAFDPAGLVNAAGATFTGVVRVEEIPLAFQAAPDAGAASDAGLSPDLSWGEALPGDRSAVAADGGLVTIQSVGGAELRAYDNATNEPLSIAPGHTAALGLAAYRPPSTGETFDAWAYDATSGTWTEQASGSFTTATVGTTAFDVYQVQVKSLGWWSVNHPLAATGCVRGVLTGGGSPLPNAYVAGSGTDFVGALRAFPGASAGAFCMDGVGGGNASLVAGQTVSATLGYAATVPTVSLSAAGTSCGVDPTQCTDLGNLLLNPLQPGCYAGTATLTLSGGTSKVPVTAPIPIGNPVALTAAQAAVGYDAFINLGVIAPSDAGAFCEPFLPGTSVTATYPGNAGCVLKPGVVTVQFPGDAGTAACGSNACIDGGIFFGCS